MAAISAPSAAISRSVAAARALRSRSAAARLGTLTTTNFGVAGSAVITGAGSSVTVTGQTIIGNFAPASLIISNGGVLNSQGGADIAIGLPFSFLGTPTVTVTGPGSTWN